MISTKHKVPAAVWLSTIIGWVWMALTLLLVVLVIAYAGKEIVAGWRQFSLFLLMIVICVGFGLPFFVIAKNARKQASEEEVFAANRTALWNRRPDWASMRATSEGRLKPSYLVFCSVVVPLVGFAAVAGDPYPGNKWIYLISCVSGLILLAAAAHMKISRNLFGQGCFHFDSLPFTPGGQVSGKIHLPSKSRLADDILLRLDCCRVDDGTRKILWHEQQRLPAQAIEAGPAGWQYVPVSFLLPPDAVESTVHKSTAIVWVLSVRSVPSRLGANYYSDRFQLPVFRQ